MPAHTHLLPSASRKHTQAHIHVRSLSWLPAFSRFRILENDPTTSLPLAPSSLRSVFRTLIPFSFLRFPPFSCFSLYPFVSRAWIFLFFIFFLFLFFALLCVSFSFNFTFIIFQSFSNFYFWFYVFSFLHFLSCISSHFFYINFFIPCSLLSLLFNFIFLLFSFFLFLYFNIAFFIFSSPFFSH